MTIKELKEKLAKKIRPTKKPPSQLKTVSARINIIFFIFAVFFFIWLFRYYQTGLGGPTLLAVQMVPMAFAVFTLNCLRKNDLYPSLSVRVNYIIAAVYVVLAIASAIYLTVEFHPIRTYRLGAWVTMDMVMGSIMIFLVLEYARKRSVPILILTILLILYCLYGRMVPGRFYHPGLRWHRVVTAMGLEMTTGVFSFLPQIGLTTIGAFFLVLSTLTGFGAVQSILKWASKAAGKSVQSLTQSAVLGSLAVGTVSGSAAANVATTGAATIPAMKAAGFPAVTAAGVETASSIGGQLMPPMMGVAAFIMAEYLGVSYWDVVARGFAPALIYYAGVVLAVYLLTSKYRLALAGLQVPKTGMVDLVNLLAYLTVVGFLIFFMGVWRWAPLVAAVRVFIGIAVFFCVFHVVNNLRNRSYNLKEMVRPIAKIVETFGDVTSDVVLLLAILGIVAGAFTITGVPTKIGTMMVEAAGGNIIPMVLIAFFFGYVVGMGVPPTPTYIIVVLAISYPMVMAGIDLWVIHFFAFFIGVFGHLSPPTSVAAAVASKIADSDYTRTIFKALQMAIPLLLLMGGVFARPGLVVEPGVAQLLPSMLVLTGTLGIVCTLHADYSKNRRNGVLLKAAMAASSLTVIFHPNLQLATLAVVPCIILIIFGVVRSRRMQKERIA